MDGYLTFCSHSKIASLICSTVKGSELRSTPETVIVSISISAMSASVAALY